MIRNPKLPEFPPLIGILMVAFAYKANKATVCYASPYQCSAAIRPNGTFTTLKCALTPQPAFCLLMPSQLGSFTLDEKNQFMSSVKMSMVLQYYSPMNSHGKTFV